MSKRRPKGTGNIRERDGRYQATYSYTDGTERRRQAKEMSRGKAAIQ